MDKLYSKSDNYLELKLKDKNLRPIVLIAPGGAYQHTSPREGEVVADVFLKAGFHTGVIYYRQTKLRYPDSTKELAEFVSQIRTKAKTFNIKEDGIYLLGFSAGGHYIASLAVDYQEYGNLSRPDALLLAYPVITGRHTLAHEGSIENLLGALNEENRDLFSLEKKVNASTPPTFLFHTLTDDAVPYQNSLLFFEALNKAKVKAEIHLYQEGPHGLSLANRKTPFENIDPLEFERKYQHLSSWPALAISWLNNLKK